MLWPNSNIRSTYNEVYIYLLHRSSFKITARAFAELPVAKCLPLGPYFILKYNCEYQSLHWPRPNKVVLWTCPIIMQIRSFHQDQLIKNSGRRPYNTMDRFANELCKSHVIQRSYSIRVQSVHRLILITLPITNFALSNIYGNFQ